MSQTLRGATTEKACEHCEKLFRVRLAEVMRGWGKYCSTDCKKADMKGKPRNKTRKERIRVGDNGIH